MITGKTTLGEMLALAPGCRCRACETGCKFGSGFLAERDLKRIARFLGMTENEVRENCLEEVNMFNTILLRPKVNRTEERPYGKCTFFDESKGCVINPVKPLQCSIATGCKGHGDDAMTWFYLKYAVNPSDPESIRQWAEYLRHHNVIQGAELTALIPDENVIRKMLDFEILR
jgi:hypothetical protein